jgi:hypothetical protein
MRRDERAFSGPVLRSSSVTTCCVALATVGAALLGCKGKLEPQATPEAAAATFLKFYEQRSFRKLDLLVDQLGARVAARDAACADQLAKLVPCDQAMSRCRAGSRARATCLSDPGVPSECRTLFRSAQDCLCSGPGEAAATGAPAYAATRAHEVLSGLGLSQDRCTITSVKRAEAYLAYPRWGYSDLHSCGAFSDSDPFATVEIQCGTQKLGLVLREVDGGWRLFGPDLETRVSLGLTASPAAAALERQLLAELRRPVPAPPPAQPSAVGSPGATTDLGCEEASRRYQAQIAKQGAPDAASSLSAADLGAVLNGGAYLAPCQVPDTVGINVCAAIQNGTVVGVTVTTTPAHPEMNRCIAEQVRRLSFPSSPSMDIARTQFAPK